MAVINAREERINQTEQYLNAIGVIFPTTFASSQSSQYMIAADQGLVYAILEFQMAGMDQCINDYCNDKEFITNKLSIISGEINDDQSPLYVNIGDSSSLDEAIKEVVYGARNFLGTSYRRKILEKKLIKERIEPLDTIATNSVWAILKSSLFVDSIDNDDNEWLDIKYPLASMCMDATCTERITGNILESAIIDRKSVEHIDNIACNVALRLFKFTRQLDDQSKYQILGNIGSIEDMRKAAEVVFENELYSKTVLMDWLFDIVVENRDMIRLGQKEFTNHFKTK